jgi:hypothetical protein
MAKKNAIFGILTPMRSTDIPEPIAAVPGTAAYDYISRKKKVSELAADTRLWMSIDPQDGQPGRLYYFTDHSCLSTDYTVQIPTLTGKDGTPLMPHEC